LTWFIRSWAAGLPEGVKNEFLELRLGDLIVDALELLDRPWVRMLPEETNFELASATMLLARKPG
jgi:hypothetical protein